MGGQLCSVDAGYQSVLNEILKNPAAVSMNLISWD